MFTFLKINFVLLILRTLADDKKRWKITISDEGRKLLKLGRLYNSLYVETDNKEQLPKFSEYVETDNKEQLPKFSGYVETDNKEQLPKFSGYLFFDRNMKPILKPFEIPSVSILLNEKMIISLNDLQPVKHKIDDKCLVLQPHKDDRLKRYKLTFDQRLASLFGFNENEVVYLTTAGHNLFCAYHGYIKDKNGKLVPTFLPIFEKAKNYIDIRWLKNGRLIIKYNHKQILIEEKDITKLERKPRTTSLRLKMPNADQLTEQSNAYQVALIKDSIQRKENAKKITGKTEFFSFVKD